MIPYGTGPDVLIGFAIVGACAGDHSYSYTAISAHVIHAPMPSNQTTATAPSAPVATADSR